MLSREFCTTCSGLKLLSMIASFQCFRILYIRYYIFGDEDWIVFIIFCFVLVVSICMATIGSVGEFVPENETITAYLERVQLFMDANALEKGKEVPVLLSVIGGKTYGLLRNHVAPDQPKSKKLDELMSVLKTHFEPKPNAIAERFHFYRRSQYIADFVAELKCLATHCVFEDHLNEALRDRLGCGLRNQSIQKRLLSETDLTFQKAVELAKGIEAAEEYATIERI